MGCSPLGHRSQTQVKWLSTQLHAHRSLILEVEVFPKKPREQLLQPKIDWQSISGCKWQSQAKGGNSFGKKSSIENEEEIEICMLPCFLLPRRLFEAINKKKKKKKVKHHQRKTDYLYSIYNLWVVILLATSLTFLFSFLVTIFLCDHCNTLHYQQFSMAKWKQLSGEWNWIRKKSVQSVYKGE